MSPLPDLDRRQWLQVAAGGALSLNAAPAKKPNIVVIMADDMGFSDIASYGSEIPTPNIDRLANGGIRFTQFYNCARCCPSRAALLTGIDNHQAGVGDMVNERGPGAYQGYLNDRCVTIAEAMRTGGYHPLMSGKWHVGENRPHWPVDRGFEHYFGLISGASNYFQLDPGRKMALDGESFTPPPEGFYMTDALTDHAVGYIRDYAPKPDPFLLYLAYTAPHWPLHAYEEDIARFRGKYKQGWDKLRLDRHDRQKHLKLVDARWKLSTRDPEVPAWDTITNKDEFDLKMAVYAAQIHRMDRGIGRVLDQLRDSGQEDNTLVLFLADNGGCHEQNIGGFKPGIAPGPRNSYDSYSRSWATVSNTPFRMFKHWVHEGGISSPFIARWPRVIKAKNTLNHEPAHITDIMATSLDIAGVKYPGQIPLAGKSLLPTFHGKKRQQHEALHWEHEGNRGIREGNWKLVSLDHSNWELYDLHADRTETRDLAAADPARVKAMSASYQQWADLVGVIPPGKLPKPTTPMGE
jgi:arylsulfatase A-like enzyme